MNSLEKFLEVLARDLEETRARWSARWREHTNRRTLIVLLAVVLVGSALYWNIFSPPNNFPEGQLVTIDEGVSLQIVAQSFQQQGVVRSALALRMLVIASGGDRKVHAGDYLFKEPKSMLSVARAIIAGTYGLEPMKFRIPEGATVAQMAKIFAPQLQRFDRAQFLADAAPLEGYLFPDTYFFLPNATNKTVTETMRNNFDLHIATIQNQIASSTHSLKDIVTMASILEREAYNTKDRRMIAGVLWNRLSRGMLLQVDATFAYTLGKGTSQITNADLASNDPYNTYKFKGLPPGPIGNPSMDSLLAAATPIKSSYLFYLADKHGTTYYSKTYEQHLYYKNLYIP